MSNQLGLTNFAKSFNKFVYLPWKTAEQMAERNEITKSFLEFVEFLYGKKCSKISISIPLIYVRKCVQINVI